MSAELDVRRRRAVWRAAHRGTKELDLLIGRFADARLAGMAEAELQRFEAFLAASEPELQAWLLSPEGTEARGPFADLVAEIRRFHGLN